MTYVICNRWIDEVRGYRCVLIDEHDGPCSHVQARRMTPADYAELGMFVPEHMRPPVLEVGGRVVHDVAAFYRGAVLQEVEPDRCEACGEDEEALCDGCACCSTCCNCTETDCDCDPCHDRRSISSD